MTAQESHVLKELSRSNAIKCSGISACGFVELQTTKGKYMGMVYLEGARNNDMVDAQFILDVPLEAIKEFKIIHGPVRLDVAYTTNPKDEHYCNAMVKAEMVLKYNNRVYEFEDATFKYRKNQYIVYPSHLSALNVLKELKPWNVQLDKSILENYTENDVILKNVKFYENSGLDLEFRVGEPGARKDIRPEVDILEYFEKVSIEPIPYEVTDGEFTHRMITRIKYGTGYEGLEYVNDALPIFLNMPEGMKE